MFHVLDWFRNPSGEAATLPPPHTTAVIPHPVITDITVCSSPPSTCGPRSPAWRRVEKDLLQYTSKQSIWLYVALANEQELVAEDLLVTDIRLGEPPPNLRSNQSWESRPYGIWVLRSKFSGEIGQAVTEVDVLFGVDAVDPRPQWTLLASPLRLNAQSDIPVARLSILYGRAKPRPPTTLRANKNNTFKIAQFSDMHMGVGVGVCKDAIDARGNPLPESEADTLTIDLMRNILDIEKPDLVILTGDQLHHDISDSQSALFKVVAPIIERSIPFTAVFGNHDSEGVHALSRTAQMSILKNLPFSLCEPGPEQIDGVGNYYLQVLAAAPSQLPLSTLYFFDSHGQAPSKIFSHDYDFVKPSQIDWFVSTSQRHRKAREKEDDGDRFHSSFAFMHIPLPEFGDRRLSIYSGGRGEPTESPSFNSHLYDALVEEGVSVIGCGHDHVNDFCALLPRPVQQTDNHIPRSGPWLCYGGSIGFRGYCSYGGKSFHRGARMFQFDGVSVKTWQRFEYSTDKANEIVLMENGAVIATH